MNNNILFYNNSFFQGWESKLRRILQNVNKRRHLGAKKSMFLFITVFVGND
jgi:hypothetical protein